MQTLAPVLAAFSSVKLYFSTILEDLDILPCLPTYPLEKLENYYVYSQLHGLKARPAVC